MFVVKMRTLFRLCAILIVFGRFEESGAKSLTEETEKCVRIIEDELKHKDIVLKDGDTLKNKVRFECDKGLKSNVPNLIDIWFKCEFHKALDKVDWKGLGVGVATGHGRRPLYLQNITCLSACPKPKFPDNMELKVNSNTKLKVFNENGVPFEDNPYFLHGDIITLDCKDGYVHEGTAERESENTVAHSNSYYNYEDRDEVMENVLTTSLQCGEDGLLNHGSDANYGMCREITCDAMSYQNVRDGSITNYKNVYQFQEVLKLKCDEGFRPYNNRDYMQCLTVDSFKNQNFKCEQIICLTPPEPLHGRIETTKVYYFPNETAVFACDYGYTMVGSPVWECQPSGEWNKSCVQCEREDDFCQPPCVQLGSRIVDSPRRIEIGTTIEFACDQMVYGGSTNRTCLFNKQWSNEPIDCTGWSLFTPNTGIYLKEALSKSLVNAVIRSNNSHNISDDKGLTQGRTINVNKIFGVDVYILIDVSKSIDDNETDVMKKFVVALVQNLDVSDKNDGTRVAVYLFATTMKALFSQRDALTEANIIEQINEIDSKTIREFQHGEGGTGTAISTALEDVHTDILTKRQMTPRTRDAQQVVILISDGKYTQRGSPVQFARNLKDLEVELYSIFVGKKEEDTTAYRLMEEMASKIGTEKHFFAIDSNNDMTDVINGMITKAPALPCGSVHTILTKTNDVNQSLYSLAEKSAWPWMVQLRTSSQVICGGTLISDQWILTAAHCFNESDPSEPSSHQNRIGTVELKTWKTDATDPFKISVPIHYTRPITKDEKNKNVFIHTKYNNPDTKSRNFTYDIALIQLPNKVTMDIDLSPVCLWGNTTEDIEDFSYSSLFKHGTYGVVTGWGYNNTNNSREKYMKQMQFPIQNFNTCEQHIPKNETPHMSEEFMFCAGTPGDDSKNIIDACSGDSGGPFMVPHPRKSNQYIQIGIVSFGIGNKCREHPYRGYYTKLNEELLDWINTIVKKYSQEK